MDKRSLPITCYPMSKDVRSDVARSAPLCWFLLGKDGASRGAANDPLFVHNEGTASFDGSQQ